MKTRLNGLLSLLVASAMAASALLSTTAQAGGGISIPLPPLPPLPIPHIKLPAPPLMVWLPIPAVYVALDSPYPIFCHEGRYYLHSNNAWYAGPGYAGPWVSVQINLLPPGLRHYHGHEWQHYQHEARYWQHHHHHAHPHFYGHRTSEHRDAQASRTDWGKPPPRHEPRARNENNWQAYRQPPVRNDSHRKAREERYERAYKPGPVRVNSQYRGESRRHGNQRWRASY